MLPHEGHFSLHDKTFFSVYNFIADMSINMIKLLNYELRPVAKMKTRLYLTYVYWSP